MKQNNNNNNESCKICGKTTLSKMFSLHDYFLTNEAFEIVKCNNCGYAFTFPMPEESNLYKYYQSSDYISHNSSEKNIMNIVYNLIRSYSLRRKFKLLRKYSKGNTILDIGSGSGEFLNYCKLKNMNAYGIEPNEIARKNSVNKYSINVEDEPFLTHFDDNSFNIITMWHVLEHVYDIDKRMNIINKILSKNGLLVLALPNLNSYDAKYYQNYWAAYDAPRHLHHFSQESIKLIAEKYNFEVVNIKPLVFDSFYNSLLSEKYKKSKLYLLKAFYRGLLSNIKAKSENNEYSSLIYVLKTKKM